jgi:hypothetical protein
MATKMRHIEKLIFFCLLGMTFELFTIRYQMGW